MKRLLEMSLPLIWCWVILIVMNTSFLSNVIVAAPMPDQKHETSPMKEVQTFMKEDIKVKDWNNNSISEMKPEITDHKFNFDEDKDGVMKSQDLKKLWNTISTTTVTKSTTVGKETSKISPFVVVAIILSGIVGLYIVYLLLLLSVVSWTYVFQRCNMYNYVEVVE